MPRRALSALVPLLLSVSLAAQQQPAPDTTALDPAHTGTLVPWSWFDRLPVDRYSDVVGFLPGVTVTPSGRLSFRGASPDDNDRRLDGFSIRPGLRGGGAGLLGFTPLALLPAQPEPGINGLAWVRVATGPLPPGFENGATGLIGLATREGDDRFRVAGALQSDALFGSRNGPGVNRFQGSAGGTIARRLRLFGALVLQGQAAADPGPGAEAAPVFDLAGVDTTVAVPSAFNDPFADTTFVDVMQFAVTRGDCDAFAGSVNPEIANNYGRDCTGIRTPATNSASYMITGRADYSLGSRATLSLSGLASQDQQRLFSYRDVTNPVGLTGARSWSRVLSLWWTQVLGARRPLTLQAGVSLQGDRTISGPLTRESEVDSRENFANLLLSPLEFQFNFDNFPLDEALVTNYRENIPGSRRTPYDLDNIDQYNLIDRYRNSPYGVGSFIDAGGPLGRIALVRENRTVVQGTATYPWHDHHRLTAGFEWTRHSIANYNAQLNTLLYSDVWIEKPVTSALFLQNTAEVGALSVTAGVRLDHFHTGAARPFVLDTVSSNPTFNTYSYFPTPSSYGAGGVTFNGQPLVKLVEDESHNALAARLQAGYAARPGTVVRAGYARENRVPDFGLSLLGVNTDLRFTNTAHPFGTNLGFVRSNLYEIGLRQRVRSGLSLDVAVYQRDSDDLPVRSLHPLRDPARSGEAVDVVQVDDRGSVTVKGAEFRLEGRVGAVQGIVGYAYQDAHMADAVPTDLSRPHTVSGLVLFAVPEGWNRGAFLGRVLDRVSAGAGFRYSSGTPYTRCDDPSVTTGMECPTTFTGSFNGSRLPAFKQFDLRVTKGLMLGGTELLVYLDARNLFNFRNTIGLFTATGRTSSPQELAAAIALDSAGLANEGYQNGIRLQNGDLDLDFGGAGVAGCANYMDGQNQPAAPNCVYLIRAEERFGDGDHVFTLAEQRRASEALYRVTRGEFLFFGSPRRLRLGVELRF